MDQFHELDRISFTGFCHSRLKLFNHSIVFKTPIDIWVLYNQMSIRFHLRLWFQSSNLRWWRMKSSLLVYCLCVHQYKFSIKDPNFQSTFFFLFDNKLKCEISCWRRSVKGLIAFAFSVFFYFPASCLGFEKIAKGF